MAKAAAKKKLPAKISGKKPRPHWRKDWKKAENAWDDGLAVRRAMFYGSVMASFCVEDYSLDRLRNLTEGEIEGRYRAFRDLTHFEDVRL